MSECFTNQVIGEILTALKERLPPKVRVEAMPDKVQKFDIGQYDAAVLVHYKGSKYSGALGQNNKVQTRAFDIDVHLLTRGLMGVAGANALLEEVRLALHGQRPCGSLPLMVAEDGLTGEDGSVWSYLMSFRGAVPIIARDIHNGPFITEFRQQEAG